MRRITIALCTIALILASGCKKDDEINSNFNPPNPVPTYTEGYYRPYAQIATIEEDGIIAETWLWNGSDLNSIAKANGDSIYFRYTSKNLPKTSYDWKYISHVNKIGSQKEDIRYYYQGQSMVKCEIYYNNFLAVTMDLAHNADGKISNADMTIDDEFLLNMAGSILGKGAAFEKLVGTKTAEQMILMAKLAQKDDSKLSIGDKKFGMTLVWDGNNLKQQILNGTVAINISSEDMDFLTSILPIPDEAQQIVQLIQLAMIMGGGYLPINMNINDTVNVTHDTNYNPLFCYWGDIFSPEILSMNNVLTQTHSGSASVSVSLMGQAMDLINTPFDNYQEFIYQYNDKKYPTQVSGDKNVTYTYRK